jgi:hypothetical protein
MVTLLFILFEILMKYEKMCMLIASYNNVQNKTEKQNIKGLVTVF